MLRRMRVDCDKHNGAAIHDNQSLCRCREVNLEVTLVLEFGVPCYRRRVQALGCLLLRGGSRLLVLLAFVLIVGLILFALI